MTSSDGEGGSAGSDDDPNPGVERRLRALVTRGFQFVHPTDTLGDVVAVVGVWVHGAVADVLELRGADDAVAKRIPAGERDVLAPATVLWQHGGDARTVLDALLALDDSRGAAHLSTARAANGCWLSVRPGRQKWLAAPA